MAGKGKARRAASAPSGVPQSPPLQHRLLLEPAEIHDPLPELGALLVDRGDDRAIAMPTSTRTASESWSEDSRISGTASVYPRGRVGRHGRRAPSDDVEVCVARACAGVSQRVSAGGRQL